MAQTDVPQLRSIPGYAQQIADARVLPPRPARHADPAQPLHPALAAGLIKRGVQQLYAHQAAAIDAIRSGADVGVVTATASGKTLCYQLPALEAALADPASRTLLLFPTKALAHDQLRALHALLGAVEPHSDAPPIIAATLDGDTPRPERDKLREQAQIVLSNPDMLHRTLLADHRRWAGVLRSLRFVVVDEAHVYRGVFGSHVALILRRLRRLCAYYGAAPQFILCSATSANPADHLAALVGGAVTVIDDDGAPQGSRTFVMWNPPMLDNRRSTADNRSSDGRSGAGGGQPANGRSSAGRRSTNIEAASLTAHLVRSGTKTLTFARTRRGAELVLRYAREAAEANDSIRAAVAPAQFAAYRAGYAVEDRRRLERAFLSGELRGLVSTNALELGVDIGGVDAVVIAGYPGSVASTWQQAGRAGRAQGQSLAVLVAQDDPLDQFYMRHPDQFFARPVEHARVALDNPYILRDQLRCAAYELPLSDADELWFGQTFAGLRDWMLRHGELTELLDGRAASTENRPAGTVNIRSADGEPVELRDQNGRVIEIIGANRAPFEVYPGAIYMHQGDTYLVKSLTGRVAECEPVTVDYYTQTIEETEVRILAVSEQRALGPAQLHLGKVEVTRRVVGYRRKQHRSEAMLSEHDLSLPPQTFRTVAVWWTVPEDLCRRVELRCAEVLDALHAMEHACIGLLPLLAQCDRADIGGLSTNLHPETGAATIFVYDGVPGGVGIAQVGYEQAELWWGTTRDLLHDCPCADGCPACVQSPKCGNGNQHLSKPGALALASLLLGMPVLTPPRRAGPPTPGSALAAPLDPATRATLLEDLRNRLSRAREEPVGPRRAALVVSLRYRLSSERAATSDETLIAELTAIDKETGGLI